MEKRPPTLLEKVREVLRLKHYSAKTDQSVHWIRQLLRFYQLRHPDVKTTMIYTHVPHKGKLAVRSPLDSSALQR